MNTHPPTQIAEHAAREAARLEPEQLRISHGSDFGGCRACKRALEPEQLRNHTHTFNICI